MKILILLLAITFILPTAFAKGEVYEPDFIQAMFYGIIFMLILTSIAIHYKNAKQKTLNVIFALFAILIISITGYMIVGTVYLNLVSESGGLIHWHADYEVQVCDERLVLQESEGLSGRIGSNELHHHNDYRIHAEGVFIKLEDTDVGAFFREIGGDFTDDTISVVLLNGEKKIWTNGDLCPDGSTGIVKFFVNGKRNYEFGDYLIAPYATVPPGDVLLISFEAE